MGTSHLWRIYLLSALLIFFEFALEIRASNTMNEANLPAKNIYFKRMFQASLVAEKPSTHPGTTLCPMMFCLQGSAMNTFFCNFFTYNHGSSSGSQELFAKKKGPRKIITLECTEARAVNKQPSRYTTTKNKRTKAEPLQLMKFNPFLNKRTLHREIK
ncbi:putative 50S ribosomal protein L33 [Cardiosporidium cionae]|uniref:50S ribosomal protein L33 n=1 Tax=Cardiosporidium cionae TaxID=476202 RepID=A0ABQ7JEQ7_9APIC|nr:putative 50S ribosomal protein L33 [Cardiosporidium cionae]|eukprot:KAF8822503.1 putative 50S ribosomal protein L33 [Cardiosporidium cionae]